MGNSFKEENVLESLNASQMGEEHPPVKDMKSFNW